MYACMHVEITNLLDERLMKNKEEENLRELY
jgi:hypothetical protein